VSGYRRQRPIGVGRCQNLIRGARADWTDSDYCAAPALDLGFRNLCLPCHLSTRRFHDVLLRDFAESRTAEGAAEWLAGTLAIIADMDRGIAALLISRAKLSEIYVRRAERDRRWECVDAVRAACSGPSPVVPELPGCERW
jgi:hypothetical protein